MDKLLRWRLGALDGHRSDFVGVARQADEVQPDPGEEYRHAGGMVVVASIVLINSALYLTSNFIIYFFKYDFGGAGWKGSYTLFSTVGGAAQIAAGRRTSPLPRLSPSRSGSSP